LWRVIALETMRYIAIKLDGRRWSQKREKSNLRWVIITNHTITAAFLSYQAIEILRMDRPIGRASVRRREK
jgi:hypothetical protein